MATLDLAQGQTHTYFVSDFTDPAGLKIAIDKFIKLNGPIHLLINNTGGPKSGPIVDAEVSEFLAAFNQHLVCNHLLMQAVVPGMKAAGFGRIIEFPKSGKKTTKDKAYQQQVNHPPNAESEPSRDKIIGI